jgi:hypothetical protein
MFYDFFHHHHEATEEIAKNSLNKITYTAIHSPPMRSEGIEMLPFFCAAGDTKIFVFV